MPTRTFFNLPEEKKERIIQSAIEEFAEYSFDSASISRIIYKAGIPRGSFYQYFADMKDIYKQIYKMVDKKKLHYFESVLSDIDKKDILEIIREIYLASIRFAGEYMEFAAIENRFSRESDVFKLEITGEWGNKSKKYFYDLLNSGQENGDIDANADIEIASLMYFNMSLSIVNQFIEGNGDNIFKDFDEQLKIADKMIYILENGLKKKN